MPAARAFPLVKLMNALKTYQNSRWALVFFVPALSWQLHQIFLRPLILFKFFFGSIYSKQKIFIEYIMLDGVNDEEQQAHQLAKLLDTFEVVSQFSRVIYILVYKIVRWTCGWWGDSCHFVFCDFQLPELIPKYNLLALFIFMLNLNGNVHASRQLDDTCTPLIDFPSKTSQKNANVLNYLAKSCKNK